MTIDTLMTLPRNVAVEAGYLAIRALKHLSGSVIAADQPFGKESIEARKLAQKMIDEISSKELRSVPGLGRARIDYYISKISEMVHERVREDIGVDAERGDALLAELRDAYRS
jgi:hypothetical protein